MRILLVGHGAREHAIAEALKKNTLVELFSFMKSKNPGIAKLSEYTAIGNYNEL
ncbi:MAG TPA: phosphoribosylamine--glycine ligase, partial [Candidatus Nanoarchaeia archaeon]|nr:phosphoribosylamine--glycine ligase [Candidatus Nanoarchaeia archaeon]